MQTRQSLVYKGYPPNHCCCDTALRPMADGSWAVIFMTGGKREPEPANHIRLCRSTDEGHSWGEAQVVHQFEDKACLLSEVYVHDGRVTIIMQTHRGDFSDWRVWLTHSTDSGYSWSEPTAFEPAPRRAFVRNLYIASWGDWYLPLQSYDIVDDPLPAPHSDGSFKHPYNAALYSTDQGQTWQVSNRVEPSHAWAENNLVELSNGAMAMFIRNDGKGCLYRADSTDRGRTWSETYPTDIPNPGSKAHTRRLSDGRILLVHNPNSATRHPNTKTAAQCQRNPMALWISDDDLQSWYYQHTFCDFPGMLAYPDGFVSDDERWLHIAFDYNRHDVIYYGLPIPD